MSDYESSLRRVLPKLYEAARRLGYDEDSAALEAQRIFVEAFAEQDRQSRVR
jgi:hypothetical protein